MEEAGEAKQRIKINILNNINFIKINKINKVFLDNNNNMFIFLAAIIINILMISSQAKKSYITLKIIGPGFNSVFFGNTILYNCDIGQTFTPPDEVIINKNKQERVTYQYYLTEKDNNIELIWNEQTEITTASCMFYTCENITEIDLSNYDSSQVNSTYRMFRNCTQLTSINFKNFNTSKVKNVEAMFGDCHSLTKIDVSSFDTSEITSMFRMFYSCKSLTSLNLSNFYTPNVEKIHEMFYGCQQLKYINLENAVFGEFLVYAGAFDAAQNLVCCISDERLIDMINNYSCAKVNCEDNWSDIQKKINTKNNSCIDDCSLIDDKYEYNSYCYEQCPDGTVSNKNNKCYQFKLGEEVKDKDELVQNIQGFIDSGIDLSDLDQGNDIEIKEEGITIAITSTDNQKNSENKNKTVIDLKACEDKLKDEYNISKNSSLYILKIDVEQKGMKIPKIEYEVYYPLFGDKLFKLNLSYCKDINIDVSIPTVINGSIDKYNSKSDYYNNICSKTSSESNIDIPLSDRKNEFIDNNLTLCEDGCEFVDYDYEYKKVKCSCEIKISLPIIQDVTIDIERLKNSFTDIKNILNINIKKCYKTALKVENIKNNYFCFIILLFFICLFSFYLKYFDSLKKLINSIILAKIRLIKFETKDKVNTEENGTNKMQKNKKSILNFKQKKIGGKNKNNKKYSKKVNRKGNLDQIKKHNFINNKIIKRTENSVNSKNKIIKQNNNISNMLTNTKNNKNYKKLLGFTDYELNSLNYNEALIHDKRQYLEYYFSLLKLNHLLIFTFCSEDYNSRIIKIFLFFYFFGVHFTVNALSFSDSTMHQIYEDHGSFNFIYQIPQIIYSSIISGVLNSIIKYLSLTVNSIISIKQDKDSENLDKKVKKLFDVLKVKFTLFFIITFLLLFLLWYYITCFCGIYTDTQIHLIKDSLISFGFSFVYPLGIFLLPGIFRVIALNDKKG